MTLSNGFGPSKKENGVSNGLLNGQGARANGYQFESAERLEESHWANIDHAAVKLFDCSTSSDGLVSPADYIHHFDIPRGNHLVPQASIISAAWAIVMSEYTNSNDVLFGELKGGKISPLRVLLKQEDTIESLLRRVEENRRTITQVTVAASLRKVQCVLAFHGHDGTEAGPLNDEVMQVHFFLHASRIHFKVLYDQLAVETLRIHRLFQQLGHVLTQLYENPGDIALGKVSSVTAKDINDMMEWNMGSRTSWVLDTVNARFERQVMVSPDSWAINGWDGSLTYAQLDSRANLLANSLYEAGVRPHDLVPLAFEKSVWFTISLLAVLKVGAAIVPLDPDWPRERRMYIVEDAGSRLALTNVAGFIDDHPELTVIDVSAMVWAPQTEPKIKFAHTVTPAHAAYVFYTSGTTGRPKGCVLEHGAFVASALERAKVLGRNGSSRVLQATTYTFDPAMEDILTTLLVGGCVCVPSKQEYMNDLSGAIGKYNACTLNIAPSFVRSLRPEQVPSLKRLILGGEKMSDRILATWAGAVSLVNAYGPTECCIKSTINRVVGADADPRNIGHPAGCSIWLTRPHDHDTLAAIGTVGEILIQGPNLAREYLNRPELTAQAFPRNLRWASQVGLGSDTRFYKTGDLARFNPDGSICLLGRKDNQVKIHGQRIELGEIDHYLRQSFPAEAEAIAGVVTFKDRETPSLVAFVQMSSQIKPTGVLALLEDPSPVQQLQTSAVERLSKVLPAYMVPSVFLPVQSFRYLHNGKTDRRGMCEQAASMSLETILKKLGRAGHETHDDSSWSADALALRQLWATALCLDPKMIGVDDTFSDLGGDSLAAIELARLCRAQNIGLTVDDIMRCPTIRTQLEDKQARRANGGTAQIAPFALLEKSTDVGKLCEEVSKPCQVDPTAIEDIYPAGPMQESLMALSMDISPYISHFVFRIAGGVKLNDLRAAWQRAAQDIPILRTRLVHIPEHGTVQVVVNEEIEWSDLEKIQLSHFLRNDKTRPMHLGDRLNRFTVVREEDGSSFLVWTCHHACHDGRTVDQVLEYVDRLRSGGPLPSFLPFKQFIQFQKNLSQSDWKTYWTRRLAGASVSSFPAGDGAVRQPLTDSVYRHSFKLPRRNIKDSPTASYSSVTLIRAAWALLVARYEGSNQATFGTIVGGSSSLVPNADAIVGPTNNTIPMTVSVPEEWTVQTFLSHVRAQFDSSPLQHVGLAQLGDLSPRIRDITRVRNLLVLQRPSDHSGDQLGLERVQVSAHENFKYPLVVECTWEGENGLSVALMFDSHIIDEVQVSRLAAQFERLIHALNANFEVLLADIDILSPSDMAQIQAWQIEVPPSGSSSLPHHILKNALTRPDAPALCSWDGDLMYAELQNLASRLSSHLVKAGVRRGDNVLCRFEKSACAVVCMLAVLKCGAACIPLGLSWPRTRLEAVSSVIKAKFVLSSPGSSRGVVGLATHHLEITMSLVQGLPDNTRDDGADDASLPGDTAFIMFTSGSTGSPKGIPLCHEQLVANLNAFVPHLRYTPQSRTYQFSDFVFDLSLSDIFGTLMAGGCLCMPSEQERQQSLAESMTRMRINVVSLTPTVAKLLTPSDVPTLRFLLLGGEGPSKEVLARWAGHVDLMNGYGMTESSVVSTTTGLLRPDSDPRNIGRAINCLAWITDANHPHRLAPIGTVGELVVQGPGVASGYLNRPDESRRVFLDTLPWSSDRNRAYRTGDLVKYDADGSIIYIGRKDAQIKVRGQRFEAGEVEVQLKQCGLSGGFCVDLVKVPSPDDPEVSVPILALFVSLEGESAAMASSESAAIARHAYQDTPAAMNVSKALRKLKSRLPDYMHPQAVVPVTRMPISGTGKLDRKVLRALVADVSYAEMLRLSFQPDKGAALKGETLDNEAQRTMAMLWAQVLPVGESHAFDAGDDFFQLGGHSITLMRLASVAKRHGVVINFREAFLRPTLAAMAECAHMGGAQGEVVHRTIPPFSMTGPHTASLLQEAAVTCHLDPAEIVDIYPSTPLQEGLMTLSLSKPGLYTAQFAWVLPESLDLNLFEAAWEALAKLNALLRTRLIYSTGYWQVVSKKMSPWSTAQSSLQSYIEQEKARPMGLGEPLSRMAIVRDTASATTYFVQTPIVPFNIFVDHVVENAQSEASLNFWKETLNDCPEPSFPVLPSSDYQQSADAVLKVEVSLPQEQRRDVTLASAIQAAWAMLLAKYEDSEDVLFAMSLGGRNADMPGIENVMGPTLCTVPVRLRPSPEQDVTSFLKGAQGSYLHSAVHGQTGLARMSKLSADAESVLKIRSLLIIHAPLSTEPQGLEKLGCLRVDTDVKDFVSYALVIECTPVPASNRLQLKISYDTGVLEDSDAHRLALQMEFVLQQVLSEACNKLTDICIASPFDMQTMAHWNRELPKPVESTLQDLFAEQAARQPDSPAICSWDGSMTYRELDSHAFRLARHLVSCGVREGDLVPLCFNKSMWVVVAMLAVLKAGGGCVCLDPNHPSDYHQGILNRIGARLIITGSAQRSMFKQIPAIGVDAVSINSMANSSAELPPVKPDQVAFVVFTSGTTGQPKGILLEHRALCTSILAHGRFMRFGPRSRVLQFASYTFDVSIADIFTTLVFGGCVCVPSDHDRMNNLPGAINALKANQAYLTSSVAALLDPDELQNPLNVLSVGGEQVGHDVLQTWGRRTNLINMYGPAETTIWCAGKDSVEPSDSPADIGRGVGARMWLTDPNDPHQLAPIGAVGEILVEGPLLARGYLGDPSRTSAAFVDTPRWAKSLNSIDGFESVTGRLYRSGDLGKYRPDGSILILGRRDTQLKIRGQRVELSEIENQLHSIIRDHRCVVDVYRAPDGVPSLVAFIGLGPHVQDGEKAENTARIASEREIPTGLASLVDGLQSRLAKVLPPYMVPAQYLVLSQMPLLASGKTDRKTLRRLASDHFRGAPRQAAPVAAAQPQQKQIPVTDMEWKLFGLWAQVLGVNNLASLGTDDNFFRCGGDSLKAMRMVSLAAQRGVQMQVADVFKHPVMADLAKALTKSASPKAEPATALVSDAAVEPFAMLDESARDQIKEQAATDCDIPVTRIEDIYPCTQLQDGLFALSQKQPGTYVAQFGFLVGKSLSIRRLREAWETVCRQIPVLRTRLLSTPSGLLQVVLDEDFWWFDGSDVDASAELSQDKAAVGGSGRPLQRFRVCRDAATGDTKLFWTIHHSAYDGWSLQRVLECVQLAYRDQPTRLVSSTPFNRFVQYANGIAASDEARKFWTSRLANASAPTFPALPEPTYRPVADSIVNMEVGNVTAPASVTLATLVRAAWAMVVGAYENSDDVVFMSTVSGRNAPLRGIETVMGPTIATIPVRVDLSDRNRNVAELLQDVQDAATEEMAFQQVGLQSIRRFSGDCEESCNARNLLIIQTGEFSQQGVILEDFQKLPDDSRDFSTFPFTLECSTKVKNQVSVEAAFDSRVMNSTQVHRILRQFQHVMLQLCRTDIALCDIEVISPSDLDEIRSWNLTMPAAREACIHHELERLAAVHPDREAICSWDGGRDNRPMNDREERLRKLWLRVLKLDPESNKIKPSDNFLSSGGDSVRAMSLVAAARREGIHLTVADIFNHPKLCDMAAAMELSSPKAKPANVAPFSLLPPGAAATAVSEASTACQVEPSQIEDIYPATPLQQGLVMLSIRDSGAYVSRFVFRLPDDIDLDRLRHAWEQVYLESPALRTRIIDTALPSQMLQVVISQKVKWHYAEDLETYYLGNKGLSNFGLGESLAEAGIIQQGDGTRTKSFFALTLHHAIYDGWSLQRLLTATEQVYHLGKSALRFAPFKNFVHHLSQADTAAASTFWRSYLSDAPVDSLFTEQGTSFKPFADKTISHTLTLGTRRTSQPGETVTSVLRAAWALILSSYKGDHPALDVVFGVVVGGRSIDLGDVENIDGPTVATIPFRVKYDQQTAGTTSLVRHVQDISSQLIQHEHLGLQSIKKLSDAARNACDFQTVLVVQNPHDSSAETGFLDLNNTERRPDTPPAIPLVVECIPSEGKIEICFHFDDRLLDVFRAERMIQQLAHVTEQLIHGDATQSIAAIQMASPSDILDIKRWNSSVPPKVESCLHDLVLRVARNTPDRIAIHSSDAVLDYRTVDRLSGLLAQHLQSHGVGPEVKVPFCMEKSASAIISILAILRSGGAFVPLDMTAPKARNREIISRVNSGLVLVTPGTRSLFDGVGCHTLLEVTMSMLEELAMSSSPDQAASPVSPSHAAYVLFTSGSTGVPKGVVVEHGAIATSVSSFASYLGFTPERRVLQFAPYVFDVSIGEIFASLASGACLCIASEAQMMNDLGRCIREMKVDFAVLTPTFAETITPDAVPGLQTLVLGGEPVRKQNVETWGSAVKLFNGYGPTEASVLSLAHQIPDAQSPVGLIGRPVGCRGWIVSQTDPNVLCPVGVVGELLIEGHSLARGYLDTPSAANEGFIARPAFLDSLAPQKSAAAARVYRTGDLVRYTANGIIQFIGRKDTQIKFHGRRIEVSEIEHAAVKVMNDAKHLAVELVNPGGTQQQALALFFQPSDANGTEEQALIAPVSDESRENLLQLKSRLAEMLPPYMVPSLFIPLTSWPRTANGKLHRRLIREAVAELSPEEIARHSLHVIEASPPATDQEKRLAAMWAATLHVDEQSINHNDSFLQHGGDSVAAVRLVTLARKGGFTLSVETVLSAPVLRDMALRMECAETTPEVVVDPFILIANPEEEIIQASVQCGVDPTAVEDIYPCSSMQSGLMALTAKNPTAYISQFVLAIPENRDTQTVQNAWNTVVHDTPVLRTRFFHPSANNNSLEHPMLQAVIRGEPEWTTATQLQAFLQRDKQTPMTTGAPLTRFAIVDDQVKRARYLVFSAHHAVYDGWSLALILERVAQALEGTPVSPATGYNAFIQHIQSHNWEDSKAFWIANLDGASPTTFPALPSHAYEPVTDDQLTHRFDSPARSSRHSNLTTATVLRSAWSMVVSRYCDSQDVVFGVTVNGRMAPIPGIETVQGPTFTTIPFRARTNPAQSAVSFLEQVQAQSIQSIPHEQYGLHNIKRLSDVLSELCDFQNLLVIQSPRETISENNQGTTGMSMARGEDVGSAGIGGFHNLALVVECTTHPTSVEVTMSFDSNILPRRQVQRLAHHLQHVYLQLQAAVDDPSVRLADISHVSPSDLAEMLEWNKSVPESYQACVHELFEERARMQPDAPAICARDGELTYSELDRKATILAAHLRQQGLCPGVLVPLLFEKSCWTIVTMLAVLKSGAANVALNPEHPQARLQGLIDVTESDHILCSRKNFDVAIEFDRQVIVVDEELFSSLESLAEPSSTSLSATARPDDPAFILFTSGTTGKPKGIVINHAAFCSSIRGHSSTLRFSTGPGSRNFQFTAYTSDVSIGEIFTSLAVGSCVCVPSDYDRVNNLAGSMRDLGVTWAFLTPSVAALLTPKEVPGLRTLLFGGETATRENISTWADSLYLINSAGPAECSIWTHCNPGISTADIGSNWGYNLGCATWITNPSNPGELMPIGVVGEMLIEGPNLAQGYLKDPERTEKAFVNVHLAGKQRRLYRTGDLARFMADGKTQFLGRKDTQVKLRGQRVEIGEIENQIRRHIPESMLVAVEMVRVSRGKSAPLLAAFIARKDSLAADVVAQAVKESGGLDKMLANIDQKLGEFLPRHMVPSIFIPLSRMPLTASAKTDRNVLAAVAATISAEQLSHYALGAADKQPPSTAAEHQMAQLWKQTLSLDDMQLGIHDSFFRIGGDSIGAMRLVSIARSAGVFLTVEQIFRNPTLQQMASTMTTTAQLPDITPVAPFSLISPASTIDTVRAEAQEQCQVAPQQIQDVYPCSALQEGLFALSLKTSGSYLAQMVFSLPDGFRDEQFKDAWTQVAREAAPILRTRFFESTCHEHRLMQTVVDAPLPWASAESLDGYLAADAANIVQLGAPTSRFAFVTDAEKGRFFVFTAHHAIYDGASLPPLFDAVRKVFEGDAIPRTSSYNLFIQYLLDMDPERSRDFWRTSLEGSPAPTFPRLPSMGYRPQTNDSLKHSVSLPIRYDTEFTASSMIRAAWSLVTAAHSDTDDIVFASTISGRTLPIPSIETIIGPTLATVPVRVAVDRSMSVSDFLTALQEQATEMLPHEQYGMQNIRHISPSISASCDLHNLLVINASTSEASTSGGLGLTQVDLGHLDGFHNFALSLECNMHDDGIASLAVSFNNRVIDPRQARRLIHQFENILGQLSTCSAHTKLEDLVLISPEDLAEINRWNDSVPPPQHTCVHTVVEHRVQSQPDAPAVCSWEGELTYEVLDQLSSALANHLIHQWAVTPGTLVPLMFEKSIWTVVAMFAVLKAGGANVPLDPEQPVARLSELVADVGATFALSSVKYQEKAAHIAQRTLVVDPNELRMMSTGPVIHKGAGPCPTDPAFILFTSGSTGKPKGIFIDHMAFCSSMKGHGEVLRFEKGRRNLQFTAYTSDVSIGEIFTSLAAGACVCVPSDFERMNDLAGAMERMKVDWAFLTPSMASLLDAEKVPTLKTLLFGGETATPENVATWASRLFLINSFGPAECSIWTHADPGVSERHNGSHIGYAIGIGELVVEGPNVARGYLNNEEKTKAAFLETAAWLPAGRKNRLYKMGDLVRYLPDGKVQFLGRKDGQIKLHGQRIEVGEIEHQVRVALDNAEISVAVEMVSLGPESSQQPFLAIFLDYENQKSDGDGAAAAALSTGDESKRWVREIINTIVGHLRNTLPRHMVPSVVLPLTRMPLNASAKTDRKVLKQIASGLDVTQLAPYALASMESASITAPSTPNEQILHRIWADILSVPADSFGTEANFMALGGDSIAAMKVIPLARAAGLVISVADIFSHPVLRALAQIARSSSSESDYVAPFSLLADDIDRGEILAQAILYSGLQPDAIEDIYPCTPVQKEFITTTQSQPGAYTLQDVYKVPSTVDLARLQRAWADTVAAHAVLRTRIFPSQAAQTGHLQVVERASPDLELTRGGDLQSYLEEDKANGMRYGERLARCALVSEGEDTYVVFTYHHSIYDAASLQIIMEDLQAFYMDESYQVDEPRYNLFVRHLLQLSSQDSPSQFWTEHLAGNGQRIAPLLGPKSDGQSSTPRVDTLVQHFIDFPMPYRHSRLNLTTAALTYAALSLVVARLTNSTSAVFELTLLGRNEPVPGIERMVGTTTTSAPLRIDITGDMTLADYLSYVQQRVNSITRHAHTAMATIRTLCPDAQPTLAAALPIAVHPSNPHKEALGSGIGLERREIRSMGQSASAFYMDVSAVEGEALEVNLPFDSRVVGREKVGRMLGLLEMVVVEIMTLSARGQLGDVSLGQLDWDSACLSEPEMQDYYG
ncbi:hypothetical protein CDV55_100668 [Aspergillus turcosus]|nr:hypothetical protein CDV55_100668 [Aspergillus turcosus]